MVASSSTPIPKTVFVVGAGASNEVHLPVGSELKKSIAKVLDFRFDHFSRQISGDHAIVEALRTVAAASDPPSRDINLFLHAGRRIHDAMPQAISIDNFIDTHNGDERIELCGKLAIVQTILDAEAKSSLFIDQLQSDRQLKFGKLENTWFHSFMQLLTENCKASDLEKRLTSVAFIIFNYDRCIEHYMYHWLQTYYSMSASDVALLLQRLEIYHPYGTVGSLPWLSTHNAIEYGSTPHPTQLLGLASQIKTFTEGTDESSSEVNSIRSNMETAHRVVFLGFAFHRLNIELLLPNATSAAQPTERWVFATALGISASDANFISADLTARGAFGLSVNIRIRNDLTCSQLFREYWRSMSFA